MVNIRVFNFFLSSFADFSVKFTDFVLAHLQPLDTDMEAAEKDGYSIYTDMGQLGAVYEVGIMCVLGYYILGS